ncbi:DUF6777 domain-containing protein [Kitasatospora sp. NPDC101176]|uniref:DUF6777 domain-containing protein n=1 Tax=Kitasatospora sp. NPDC101176 TaxID=3364099 RepID=UPI003823B51A
MSSQPPPPGPPSEPPFGPPSGPPSGPLSGPQSGGGTAGPPSGSSGSSGMSGPPSGPGGPPSGGGRGPHRPWWRSGKGLALAAGTVVVAVLATVLIVNNQGGHNDAVPAANEVALQAPSDPGPDPFTPSVETQAVAAPAPQPATSQGQQPAQSGKPTSGSPATLHSVEGSSAGLYGGTMNKPSCDTERLITMVSAGDGGRAWASAAGIEQSAIPSYLRSLTSVYLRVDTRVTNHSYKSGAVTEYQSALQAGTAVLVDAQGVPRVRCSCGNPLKPPVLVSNAKYTGKAWTGFQPTTLVVVVPAPQPVTEIVLVNIETAGWFARVTGQIKVVDKRVEQPKGPLAPGVPPPSKMTPTTAPATSSSSSGTTSGSGSPSTSGATSSGATSSGATSSGATSSGATSSGATSSGATSSGATSSGATKSGASSSGATSSGPTSSTSSASSVKTTATGSTSAGTAAGSTKATAAATTGTTTAHTPTATCVTSVPATGTTLPPCPTTSAATP